MLVDNWRRVVALSLSFWMQVLGLLALIVPELWYFFTGEDYDPRLMWGIGVGMNVAGLVGRLWQQGVSPAREWIRIVSVALVVLALALLLAFQASAAPQSSSRRPKTRRSISPFPLF
jgi:lysozyme